MDGDLDFENDYRWFVAQAPEEYKKSGFYHTFLELSTDTGLKNNFAPIGCSVLWLPWFAAADLYVRTANIFGADIPADGFSPQYIQLVAYGSMVYGFLGLLLIFSLLRKIFDKSSSLIATLLIWFATSVVYYMYVQAPMSHSCSLFVVSLFVWYWLRTPGSLKWHRWLKLGLILGLAGLVREQNLFFVVLIFAEITGHLFKYFKEKAAVPYKKLALGLITAGAASFLIFMPQLIVYKILYDRFGPSPMVSRKMFWHSPYSWEVLFNYSHGLFFWTPVLFFAAVGLILFSVRHRFIGISLLSAFLVQVYVSGAVRSWHASGSFGHRRFINCSIIFAVGLGFLIHRTIKTKFKIPVMIFSFLLILWNLQLIVQFATNIMDRRKMDIAAAARNAVLVVPERGWEIAKKFFTSREELIKIKGGYGNEDEKEGD